jgi:hypothetical protein
VGRSKPRHLSWKRYSTAPPIVRGAGRRSAFLAITACFALAVVNVDPIRLNAQEDDAAAANREYAIKAAYLYQFGRYVQWPDNAFSSPEAPFVIGLLDHGALISNLEQIAQAKKVQDRPIQVRRFSSADEVGPCHILFVSGSLPPKEQAEAIARLAGQNTLLVGEAGGFLDWGGAVRFSVEDNKVRIRIARKTAEQKGLSISAKLLQVAHVVD